MNILLVVCCGALWPTWWGLLYNLQIRTKQQLSQSQSRSRSRSQTTLNYGFHRFGAALCLLLLRFVWGWPQTNQLTAINLTSVASVVEGLSRVSLDYLTFNFCLQGGGGRRGQLLWPNVTLEQFLNCCLR